MAGMPSISINKESLALVIGCITVTSTVFGVYNWLLSGRAENAPLIREIVVKNIDQDVRLDRTDRDRERGIEATKEQTAETQKLKEAVVRLTTVIEQNGLLTKKAEYHFESPIPGGLPIKLEVR